jgi:hypothetical protein
MSPLGGVPRPDGGREEIAFFRSSVTRLSVIFLPLRTVNGNQSLSSNLLANPQLMMEVLPVPEIP